MNLSNNVLALACAMALPVAIRAQAAVTQPCGDIDYGIDLQLGDDEVAAATALGFAFPVPGGGTVTSIGVSSNGFVWLDGSTEPGCCNGYELKLLNRGPRIAPFWLDLDPSAGGAVRFRAVPASGIAPAHAIVTWDQVREWGAPVQTPPMTFQLLLFADGSVTMRYDHFVQCEAYSALTGLSSGNGAAPNGIDLSTTAGAPHDSGTLPTVSEVFFGGGPGTQTESVDLANSAWTFVPNGQGGYLVTEHAGCTRSRVEPFGSGCPRPATFYEVFDVGAPIDLGGTAIDFLPQPNGGYFAVQQGTFFQGYSNLVPLASYGTAGPMVLPFSYQYPGGSTSTVYVSSHGFVWLQPLSSPFYFFADPQDFVYQVPRIAVFSTLLDLSSSPAAGIYYDVVGTSEVHITWVDVPCDGGGQATFQLTLRSDNSFQLSWGNLPSSMSLECLVGFSQGNSSFVPAPTDLSALPFQTSGYGVPAWLLPTVNSLPVVGSTFSMDLWNADPSSAVCIMVLGLVSFPAGIDLTPIGMDGCSLYVTPDVLDPFPFTGLSSSYALPIPPSPQLLGQTLAAQAATVTPTATPIGLLTSNGLAITLGF